MTLIGKIIWLRKFQIWCLYIFFLVLPTNIIPSILFIHSLAKYPFEFTSTAKFIVSQRFFVCRSEFQRMRKLHSVSHCKMQTQYSTLLLNWHQVVRNKLSKFEMRYWYLNEKLDHEQCSIIGLSKSSLVYCICFWLWGSVDILGQ